MHLAAVVQQAQAAGEVPAVILPMSTSMHAYDAPPPAAVVVVAVQTSQDVGDAGAGAPGRCWDRAVRRTRVLR